MTLTMDKIDVSLTVGLVNLTRDSHVHAQDQYVIYVNISVVRLSVLGAKAKISAYM